MVYTLVSLIEIIVDTGHAAIKFNKLLGVRELVFREGMHVKVPWFERPIIYDVRTHPTVIKSMTGSKGKIYFTKWNRFTNDQH